MPAADRCQSVPVLNHALCTTRNTASINLYDKVQAVEQRASKYTVWLCVYFILIGVSILTQMLMGQLVDVSLYYNTVFVVKP